MKHPRCVNRTSIPWSMICPTDTKFFVIVGTCSTFMSFPFCTTWLRELLRHSRSDAECRLQLRLLPVASVFPGTRTTPYGSSYDLTRRSQRTTPRPISGWFASLSLLCVSSRRQTLFRLSRILRRSAIAADFPCRYVSGPGSL